jgi:hypothetical protein
MIKRNRANTGPHEQFEAELAELALGALYKGGQVALLGHIASCADCAAGLQDLVVIADDLLLLAPEVDPPVGFDERVIERAKVSSLCW